MLLNKCMIIEVNHILPAGRIYNRIPLLTHGLGPNVSHTTWTQALWLGGQGAWRLDPYIRKNNNILLSWQESC